MAHHNGFHAGNGAPPDSRLQHRLRGAVAPLFDRNAWPGDLFASTRAAAALFAELTRLDTDSSDAEDQRETVLESGTAISPRNAARCLLDCLRTAQFLRGIEAAIREARDRFPVCRIEILYAGCGPYALLAVPVCTRFAPDEVRFTLLDVHQRSLDAARALVDGLGLSEYVADYVLCDAATYEHPTSAPPHIVICEAMQRALAKEPQLAIAANLVPQLAEGGILVPERVSVDLCLADVAKEFPDLRTEGGAAPSEEPAQSRDRRMLAHLLEVTKANAPDLHRAARAHDTGDAPALPSVRVSIPPLPPESRYQPMLLTTIDVFGGTVLADYDSGLTYPVILHDLGVLKGGETLSLQYRFGRTPGFTWGLVTGASPT